MARRTNTQERLVATAAALFLRQGYAGTGVNEIMQQAGTAAGSFYHFFPTKEDLLLAVVERAGGELAADWKAAATPDGDPIESLLAVLDAARARLGGEGVEAGSPLAILGAELSLSHPAVRARIAGSYEAWIARAAGLLVAAGGRLPAGLDRRALAHFILASIEGGALLARVEGDPSALDSVVAGLGRHLAVLADGGEEREPRPQPERPHPPPRPAAADWRAW